MKLRKPDYYDRFQCIAGACGDSCCIGWEIDINEKQKQIYQAYADQTQNELSERMKSCIDWEKGCFILQGENERCPFLNQENLCDLIRNLGEESLCDICREHPRFYEWYEGLTEVGLGLCCEAAVRLMLEHKEPIRFVEEACEEPDGQKEEEADAEFLELLFAARDTAFAILQNRNYSVWDRLIQFLDYTKVLQDALDFGDLIELSDVISVYEDLTEYEKIPEAVTGQIRERRAYGYRGMLEVCRELEAIDDSWMKHLEELYDLTDGEDDLADYEAEMLCSTEERSYEYEHLAVSFVYRYFMKCRKDRDVYSKGCLTVFSLLMIRLLDIETWKMTGKLTTEDRVQNIKCISKEVEYSEENLEMLSEAFWERDEVSKSELKWLLVSDFK